MKILAIDSSSVVATVALTDESKIIAEYSVNHKKYIPRHYSQWLMK